MTWPRRHGAVYRARQKSLDRLVAIKILPPGLASDADERGFHFAERFQREARAMARLSHPNIIGVYDFGETKDGQFYFVMEYIEGANLHELISGGGLTPEHVTGWISQVCDALQYAHGRGIVHRDIKPANIMITREGQVKVADFGLAKLGGAGEEAKLTMTNMAMGTPDYIAPEALESGVEVDHRADLYAVGVMIYEMLTGKVPRGNWKMPSVATPGLDPRYDDLVTKAIEVDRDERYQNASEIAATIYEIATTPLTSAPAAKRMIIAGDMPLSPAREERSEPLPPPRPRGKSPWLLIGTSLAVLAVGAVGYLMTRPEATPAVFDTTKITAGPEKLDPEPLPVEPDPPKPEPEEAPKAEPVVAAAPVAAPVAAAVITPPLPVPAPESEANSPAPTTPPDPAPAPVAANATMPSVATPPPVAVDPVSERLASLEKTFHETYTAQIAAAHDRAVVELNTKYIAALDRAITTASAASQLEEALSLRDEKTQVETGGRVPDDDGPDLPPSLAKLRETWRDAHAPLLAKRDESALPLLASYDRALAAYQDELTKAQNLDGASRIKAVRDQVSSQGSRGATAATSPAIGASPGSATSAGIPIAPPLPADQVLPPLPKATPDEIRSLCEWALTRDTARLDILDSARPVTVAKGQPLPKGTIKLIGFELERFPMDDEGLKWLAILGRAPDLERLVFSSATDRIPLELLRGATKLKELTPTAAVYDETSFAHLSGLKNLEKLTIMSAVREFTGTALGYVPDSLVELHLDSPTLTIEGMAYLPRFKKLKRLSFDHFNVGSRCNVNDAMLRGLASLPALEELNLSGCPVDGSFLASLPPNLKLKILNLIYVSSFDPAHLVHLAKLAEIKSLSLPSVAIPPDALAALAELDGLEELLIRENPFFTGEEFRGLTGFRSLAFLDIFLSPVTDAGLAAISEAAPGLTRFDLASREDKPFVATGAGFAVFAERVPGITNLSLDGPAITDDWVPEVAKLTKVEYLTLIDTEITDAGLTHLKDLPLGYLRLSGTNITDAAIPILKSFPNLGGVPTDRTQMTDAGRAELQKFFESR